MSRAHLHHQRQETYTNFKDEIADKYWQISDKSIVYIVAIDLSFRAIIKHWTVICNYSVTIYGFIAV